MDSRVKSFLEKIKGKKIALVGVGVSHRRLAGMLAEKGAKVTVLDRREKEALGNTYTCLLYTSKISRLCRFAAPPGD